MKRILLISALLTSTALAGEHVYGPFPADYVEECATCHTAAERGDYAERGLKLPGGWRRTKQH